MITNQEFQEKWAIFALHTWLISSSYGIMFAILSFIEDLGGLNISKNDRWIKGVLSLFLGVLYYFIIGLPHLKGSNIR
jgi:hypothetical protein